MPPGAFKASLDSATFNDSWRLAIEGIATEGTLAWWSHSELPVGPQENITVFITLLWKDASKTFYRVQWEKMRTPNVKCQYCTAPKPRSPELRTADSTIYGKRVAEYATKKLGKEKVGRGECYDLAKAALENVNKELGGTEDPVWVSSGSLHGQCIFEQGYSVKENKKKEKEMEKEGSVPIETIGYASDVRPGDIIQFDRATFIKGKDPVIMGRPDHTSYVTVKMWDNISIVIKCFPETGKWYIIDQSGESTKTQVEGFTLEYVKMTGGRMWVYRPVPMSWLGNLSAAKEQWK